MTSLTIVYSADYPGADQRKHQSSASLAFVWGIHRWPVNSPHKWPETRKMFPFDGVIMDLLCWQMFKPVIRHGTDSKLDYIFKALIANILRPRLNGRHSADDIFECISMNANFWILNMIIFYWNLFFRVIDNMGSIGSDYVLAPIRREAIIWSKGGMFTDAFMRRLASMA